MKVSVNNIPQETTKSESTHKKLISWLIRQLCNVKENHSAAQFKLEGRIPDIVILKKDVLTEAHEVEVLNVKGLPQEAKRVLWIAVPHNWEEIHVIHIPSLKEEKKITIVMFGGMIFCVL